MPIDQEMVEQFVGQLVGDVGATVSSALAHLGHRLGLYRAMDGAGPLPPKELARRTAPTSATSESGSTTRRPAATSRTTPATYCDPQRPEDPELPSARARVRG